VFKLGIGNGLGISYKWYDFGVEKSKVKFRVGVNSIIYPCAHDMPYTSAIFLADLPTKLTCCRDQLARKLFKSTIQPTSSLHNLLPPHREHPSITRLRVPQNFLASPPEPKNTNHSSHMLSPTIRLHNCVFSTVFIVFCVCFCVCFYFYCSASGCYFQ